MQASPRPLGRGIRNVCGNQCFFNSVVQALRSCKSLLAPLVNKQTNRTPFATALVNMLFDGCTTEDLRTVLLGMSGAMHMSPRYQNDAHECMLKIVELLYPDPKTCPMASRVRSLVVCDECEVREHSQMEMSQSIYEQASGQETLRESLSRYHLPTDAGRCDKCRSTQLQKLDFQPGNIHVVHFRRSRRITPPRTLHGGKYDLVAMVVHHGSLDFGHYVCYVAQNDGTVLLCNDDQLRELPDFPKNQPVYMLFFERRKNGVGLAAQPESICL